MENLIRTILPELDERYKTYALNHHFPGYAYGILLDGKLIHTASGGFIDTIKKIPATPKSMFRIASMTKSFTAMAVLKLRDEGNLRLDDPVEHYIPQMRGQRLTTDDADITIRDLLVHSAGLPTDDPWADRLLDQKEEDLFLLLEKKLNFSSSPGTAFEYSNLGYTLLGSLIQKASGLSYQEYINKTILGPLGMCAFWDYKDAPQDRLARGYRFKDAKREEEPLLRDGIFGAMGGLITSIESFSKYLSYHQSAWLQNGSKELEPIKKSSLREMHQPLRFIKLESNLKYTDGSPYSLVHTYGYGLKCLKDSRGSTFIGHRGGLPGFGSNWFFLPEYGLGMVSFANTTYADTYKIDLDIVNKLIHDLKIQPKRKPPSNRLKTAQEKLLPLLPEWNEVPPGIFACNFFLDRSLHSLKKESLELFAKLGNILSIEEITPENQLRGSFIIKGEKASIQIHIALTPENPSLIQQLHLKEIDLANE